MLKQYPDLEVDVLKARQHGSKNHQVHPFRTAQTRDDSHLSWKEQSNETPHQETLTRLETINSKVYRTDQQGAIRFKGWKNWKIESVR